MSRTQGRRALLAVPLALLALWLLAAPASAHSYLVESDPADGAFLLKAPTHIVLLFSSGVTSDFTSADLVEASGNHYQLRSIVIDKTLPSVVSINLPQIPNGSYRLSFTTRDRVDLHQTAGSIVFGVGVAPATSHAAPAPAPAKPSEYLLRWVSLAGLSALFGGLLLALLIIPRLPDTAARRRTQTALLAFAFGGASLQLMANAALIIIQAVGLGPDLTGNVVRLVVDTEYGSRWLLSTVISLVIALFLAGLWHGSRRGREIGFVAEFRRLGPWAVISTETRLLVLVAGLTVATAVSGHAANAGGLQPVEVVLRSLHLASMGIWAGGVVALLVAAVGLRRAGDRTPASTWTLAVGFGPYAGAGFALLAVTGLLLSGSQVASLTALLTTSYGLVLIAKVLLAGLVALVALRHALISWRGLGRKATPAEAPRRLLLTLGMEGAGAMGLVLLAAVLGSSAPARGPQFEPPPAAAATLATKQSSDLLASVSMKPNRDGLNLLSVQVVDSRRPSRAPVQGVTFVIQRPGLEAGPQLLPTSRSGERFDAGTVSMKTGEVKITVLIHREGVADTVVEIPWRVNPPLVKPAPVVVSSEPLAPLVDRLALAVAILACLTGLVCAVRAGLRPRREGWVRRARRAKVESLNQGLPNG
jgi:copper transport protein